MKQILSTITLCILVLGFSSGYALAGPDEYIGDAAIYTLSSGSASVEPNILFVIDNSYATQNVSVGYKYGLDLTASPLIIYKDDDHDGIIEPEDTDHILEAGAFNPWDIYVGDNQGNFTNVVLANSTVGLENLNCSVAGVELIKGSLLAHGSYAGAGSADHPNIGSAGGCTTASKGEIYLLGNYLNYLNTTPSIASGAGVCVSAVNSAADIVVAGTTPSTKNKRYKLIQTHIAATDNEPGVGTNWTTSWSEVSKFTVANQLWAIDTEYRYDTTCPTTTTGAAASTQREIVYDALKTVISGARFVGNFGAMVYGDNNSGGAIIVDPNDASNTTDIADISADADLDKFLALLPGSPSGGAPVLDSITARPQAEALYDAGYYLNATYPSVVSTAQAKRIPSGVDTVACGSTHVILITNGLSNGDGGSASTLGGVIGDYDQDGWSDEAVYGLGSHYLDDVASYMKSNLNVTTHTVLAFQNEDPLVKNTALDGHGQFYNVFNPNELQEALENLILNILLEANSAFVAPVVPSNPENRTYSGSRIYLGLFRTITGNDWIGNIKKYAIDSSGQILDQDGTLSSNTDGDFKLNSVSFWNPNNIPDGGIVHKGGLGGKLLARVPTTATTAFNDLSFRNIYSNLNSLASDLTDSTNRFDRNIAPSAFDLSTTAERDSLVNYIYGHDAYDNDGNGIVAEPRTQFSSENPQDGGWLLGDTLHAKPAIVNYNIYRIADNSTDLGNGNRYQEDTCPSNWSTVTADFTDNKTIIFAGTNDGQLHAFSDCNGEELWSFIPDNLLPQLKRLHDPVHTYYMDASPAIYTYDKNHDGTIDSSEDKVIMIVGQRRGGSRDTNVDDVDSTNLNTDASFGAYYVLDITIPDQPHFLWKVDRTVTGFEEMGETWSQPKLAKVKVSGADKIVAIIGAGYDNLNEDGRFGATQQFSDTSVGAATSDGGTPTSTGTTAATALTNNPKGRGIFAFEIATPTSTGVTIASAPTLTWSFTHPATVTPLSGPAADLDYSIPSDVGVFDTDFDGYIDRLYVGDTGGQVWRISAHQSDIPYANADISTWTGHRIFNANHHASDSTITKGRKFFFRPSVVILPDHIGVVISSGDRAHPMNNAVPNRIFAIKDKKQDHSMDIALDDLVDTNLYGAPTNPEFATSTPCADTDTSNECILNRLKDPASYGWFIDASDSTEKFLASALVFNGTIYQTSYVPTPPPTTPGACAPSLIGESYLYALDYFNSGAALNLYTGNDSGGSAVITSDDRSKAFGTGIPPEVTVTIPKEGDPRIILPKPEGITVEDTATSKVVFPLYWWQK